MSDEKDVPLPREHPPHPFAEIFPPMSNDEREELEGSIRQNGLRKKIIIDKQGRILDGLNRYRACLTVGVTPQFEVFEGADEQAKALIWDANIVRRHLSTNVKAAIGADWTEFRRGQRKSGNSQISVADAAKQLNISASSINVAKAIKRASPELHKAVKTNTISLNAAEAVVKLPEMERGHAILEVINTNNKKHARIKAKAAESAHLKKSAVTPSSTKKGNSKLQGTFAPLMAELDELPHLLDQNPLSQHQLRELKAELQKALAVVIAVSCPADGSKDPPQP